MDRSIPRQFAYDDWANRRVARSLRTVTGRVERPLTLLAHLLNAERLWLSRILDEPGPLPWDERTLDECDRLIEENRIAYAALFDSDRGTDEHATIDYRNTQGASFKTSLGDILQHVLLHGCYHRGQIATAVKAEGGEPASTDFILYVREVESGTEP